MKLQKSFLLIQILNTDKKLYFSSVQTLIYKPSHKFILSCVNKFIIPQTYKIFPTQGWWSQNIFHTKSCKFSKHLLYLA